MGNCNNINQENVNNDEMITRGGADISNSHVVIAKNIKAIRNTDNNVTGYEDLNVVVDEDIKLSNQVSIPILNDRIQDCVDVNLKFEEAIKSIGFISTEETMNAKTYEFITTIEERENLAQVINEIKEEETDTPDLLGKKVIQYFDGSFYNGTFNFMFKRHGIGSLLMKDGSKYSGSFKNDNIEGKGYYIDSKGRLYIGYFVNGKANGKGKITLEEDPGYSYEGDFVENFFEGQGEERQPNGNYYIGNFKEGLKQGYGKLIYSDGSCYEGNFIDSKIEGQGTFKWKDGRIYTGEFFDNKLNGKGRTTWVDGSYYDGEYKNDHFNGFGELVSSDGSIFRGNWLNSLTHGIGYYKDSTSEYKGIWRFNKNIKKF